MVPVNQDINQTLELKVKRLFLLVIQMIKTQKESLMQVG